MSTPQVKPAVKGAAVTPSDSTVLLPTRGLYVGGAGDVAVILAEDDTAVTLTGCSAGLIYPLSVTKVMSTNTTATSIVALW